jgi:YbgC/YbaW family acyl-CoA thioester hydrolase
MGYYKMTIKEHHLDTFGHVNNATYLQIFEEARWEMIHNNGFSLEVIKKKKQGPIILDVHVKFLRELKNRENISVETVVTEQGKKVGKISQKIKLEDGTVSAEALFTFALFDLVERKIIEPTPEWKRAIGI